ncbi:MAG TPA: AMP-binding protein [Acidimicrobiales bacterium]|nr:AMP-binding protein [Acidimicrobiales bacterium]
MRRLVVLEARGTDAFVDGLRRAWDDGDAVLPLDPRLPPPARRRVLAAARRDEPVEEVDALVVATSGTSGDPKAAVLTHDAVAASARATSERLGVDPATDRWLACLPLAHVGGLSVVTRALLTGTPLSLQDGFDAEDVRAAATAPSRPCTLVSLVPTMLWRLDPATVGAFRAVVLGGSAMPPRLPPHAVATYGMTETGSGVVYDGEPLDGVEVRVEGGEIQLRCPMLLRAYRDGTDPTAAEGWFPTGDAGAWDPAARRLRVFGRLADVIVTGGENVWPTAVERALADHPGVREVAVVGRPDPEWGRRVVALVVPADPAEPPTLDALRAHAKGELPAYAAPRELDVVRALPRTASGKVARSRLI